MANPTVQINQKVYGWNSTIHSVAGVKTEACTGIDFDEKIVQELVYAAKRSGIPVGIQPGKYDPGDVAAKYLLASTLDAPGGWVDTLEPEIASLTGSSGDVEFPVTLQYEEPSMAEVVPGGVITIVFPRMKVMGRKLATDEGTGTAAIEITFKPLGPIFINGITLAPIERDVA
jgi:hypothetical protein